MLGIVTTIACESHQRMLTYRTDSKGCKLCTASQLERNRNTQLLLYYAQQFDNPEIRDFASRVSKVIIETGKKVDGDYGR